MANLATTYHILKRYEEEMNILVEVLALRREILGNTHLDTVQTVNDLTATYHALGRYKESEKM